MSKIIKTAIAFRLDDICNGMTMSTFERVMALLMESHAAPLLGVVPDCQDSKLLRQDPIENFDEKIHSFLENGCEIAMHGFQHRCDTPNHGILHSGTKSEFAGHSREEQRRRIQDGVRIMKARGYEPKIFMAPSHTFDEITLAELKNAGFAYMTDGYTATNYSRGGLIFVPCRNVVSLRLPLFGIVTVCLHTNTMNEEAIRRLMVFMKKYQSYLVPYHELLSRKCVNSFRAMRESLYRLQRKIIQV